MNNSLQHPISKIISRLAEGICKYGNDLEIKERLDSKNILILISPHMADYPKMCGQNGRQIQALRYLVKHMGRMHRLVADLDLKESWRGERENRVPFNFNPDFEEKGALSLLNDFRSAIWPGTFEEQGIGWHTDGDKLHIYLMPMAESDASIIIALADVFYPYGYRNGRKISIHAGPENSEHRTIRQSPVSGGKRER